MKKTSIALLIALISSCYCFGQAKLLNVKSKTFQTSEGLKIEGQVGSLEVPENRNEPDSRKIRLTYVHLKSLAEQPAAPIVYLEGGGGFSTWEASSPRDLQDRIQLLEVADLIYLDRRGVKDGSLSYLWKGAYPRDFFVSEEQAAQHYRSMADRALEKFRKKGIDISGYHIEAHAQDVHDLMAEIGVDHYTLFGFSYGSHIGMTVMDLYPKEVERAILVGADAPHQAFNYPRYLDEHIETIGSLVEEDSTLNMTGDKFRTLVYETLERLTESPVPVTIRHPLTRKKIKLPIGGFGLGLILRLDIDDAYDIPVIPRLLHSINHGDYSMLTWFVQKRIGMALELPGQGINQQLASGASPERWAEIERQARESAFGNVVNFPFSAVKGHWPETTLSFDPSIPLTSEIPTLFITGTLDCRTPVAQVEELMQGFANAAHIQVQYAGHEQAQWDGDVADIMIPSFLKGERIESTTTLYSKIEFVPVSVEASGHPSVE
ncbi:MAG: alpha/beta fold hydrolase [Bacteroidota bacterium]